MLVMRPVMMEDLDPLVQLAEQTGHGLTTLPRDRQLLRRRIVDSLRGFEQMTDERPRGETYLLVLEDLSTGRVVGTSGIVSKVGGFEPFYAYRIETAVHESDILGVRREVPLLKLVAEHNGPSEIGSLFLAPEYRKDGNGRVLSLVRFLFMAEFPDFFDKMVLAEMRGSIDAEGCSPFWNAIGRHFFAVDFCRADYLSMVNKKFIADLMPTHPIYIPLLPKDAQDVVGQVHPHTRPALQILEGEGFTFAKMVDIFDGGPIVSCRREQIRSIRDSRRAVIAEITDDPIHSMPHLIGTTRRVFRACKGTIALQADGRARLAGGAALALGVRVGDWVRFVPLHPPASQVDLPPSHVTETEKKVAAAKQEAPEETDMPIKEI